LPWRRENDVACAGPQVSLQIRAALEDPGTLEDQVDFQVFPRQTFRIAFLEGANCSATDHELAVLVPHLLLVAPVNSVVLEQIGKNICSGEIVHRHQFQLWRFLNDLERGPADPAESIDGNASLHHGFSPFAQGCLTAGCKLNRSNPSLFPLPEAEHQLACWRPSPCGLT